MEIRRAEDIAPAFAALNVQADPLYVVEASLMPTGIRTKVVGK
jgi:hypothetical protein